MVRNRNFYSECLGVMGVSCGIHLSEKYTVADKGFLIII